MIWESAYLPQSVLFWYKHCLPHQSVLFWCEPCLPHQYYSGVNTPFLIPLYKPDSVFSTICYLVSEGTVRSTLGNVLTILLFWDCLPLLVLEAASAVVTDIPWGNFSIYFVHVRGTNWKFCYWEIKINTLRGTFSKLLNGALPSPLSPLASLPYMLRLPSPVFRKMPEFSARKELLCLYTLKTKR